MSTPAEAPAAKTPPAQPPAQPASQPPSQPAVPPLTPAQHSALAELRPAHFRSVQAAGYHLQPNDFYSPVNDTAFLAANRDLWTGAHEPADIDWDLEHQLRTAREVAQFVPELRDIPQTSGDETVFCWKNFFWNNADALVQYGLVRSRRPRRYIEVGCGWSSLLLARALARNEAEGAPRAEVTQIEPYPRAHIMAALPAHWKQQTSIIQRVPLELFETLEAGDVLFYDGSHCAKIASDVNWFFFRVLPRVRSGVIIHLHDIFFPFDYPEDWTFEWGRTWNEQYVLQAFLMHNDRYKIELANRYAWAHRARELDALYQGVQPSYGCSIWLRKK